VAHVLLNMTKTLPEDLSMRLGDAQEAPGEE